MALALLFPNRQHALAHLPLDFPFSGESVHEESLCPIDEDISGAVFAQANPGAGASEASGLA